MLKNKESTKSAIAWSFLERFSTQIIAFFIGIVLARLLSPHDYGIIGIIAIFIAFSNVFIDAGFSNALIRKIDSNDNDFSTAFYANIVIGIIVYLFLWFSSPFIASFFNEKKIEILIKIAGVNIILNSLCIVQNAILTAKLNIKLQTIINISAQIPSGLFAIYLAYCGFGVFALVFQTVSSSFLKTILLWICTHWRPCTLFSIESFKYLWNFGSKLLCANLIGVIFNEIYSILIGKFINKESLGYYSKASQLNTNFTSISTGVIQKIALPILAEFQDDKSILREKFRLMISSLLVVMAPLTAFLCFSSHEIIIILWTEKWSFSSTIFSLLIVGSIFSPLSTLSLTLLQVVGKSGTILKLEAPKKAIYIILIFYGFYYGVIGLTIAAIFINIVAAIINMYPIKKIINYRYMSQFSDILLYMLYSYPLAFIIHLLININNVYLAMLAYTVLFFPSYLFILIIAKDKILYKYIKMIKH